MQGYIIWTQSQKNEDLIVRVLTSDEIKTLYRFYGARHSIVHIGRKIDFIQESNGVFMPKLRQVLHVGFKWERDVARVYVWQRFMELLHYHLRDIFALDARYMEILDEGAKRLEVQNPKRVALEMYAKILHHEGRNPLTMRCLICEQYLDKEPLPSALDSDMLESKSLESKAAESIDKNMEIAILRGFLSAHKVCASGQILTYAKLESYLSNASTIELSDDEVERAYQVLLLGM